MPPVCRLFLLPSWCVQGVGEREVGSLWSPTNTKEHQGDSCSPVLSHVHTQDLLWSDASPSCNYT